MVRTVGEDDSERKVLDDIENFGWHCVHIQAEADLVEYSFTIGLFQSFKHPELIIFGLPRQTAHQVLALVADAARAHAPIDLSSPTDALLKNYSCCFAEVPRAQYHEHMGYGRWYYMGNGFPLYQVIWPSRDGFYPWHPKATESFRVAQPVIASPADGS